jgi:hypothetical protein
MKIYKAHYWVYGNKVSREFLGWNEAIKFLQEGELDGGLATDSIELPSGVVLDKDDLHPIIWGHEKVTEFSEPKVTVYERLVYWQDGDYKMLYGVDGENYHLLSRHDHNAVLANIKEVDTSEPLQKP